jgi:hypothetical protein
MYDRTAKDIKMTVKVSMSLRPFPVAEPAKNNGKTPTMASKNGNQNSLRVDIGGPIVCLKDRPTKMSHYQKKWRTPSGFQRERYRAR